MAADLSRFVSWLSPSFNSCSETYERMIELLSITQFTKLCVLCFTSGDLDEFTTSLVELLVMNGQILPVFQELLKQDTFIPNTSNCTDKKTASSKFMTAYARLIGKDYLSSLLSDLTTEIVLEDDINFELQRNILAANRFSEDDPRIEEELRSNRVNLCKATKVFIGRITDPKLIHQIPMEILHIIKFVPEESRQALVNDFLMFKMISPAIVTPESYDLIPSDIVPSKRARRNLVLITNLLRNCESGKICPRENYMSCTNTFVREMHPLLVEHANRVAKLNSKPQSRIGRPSIFSYDFYSLLDVHLILHRSREKILASVAKSTALDATLKEKVNHFFEILGLPPHIPGKNIATWRRGKRNRSISSDPVDVAEQSTMLTSPSEEEIGSESPSNLIALETALLDKAGFIFLGPNSRDGLPVLYLIVNRVQPELCRNVDLLVTYIYQITTVIGDSRYILVVDMSWAKVSEELRALIKKELSKLLTVIERRIRKNLAKVFIVHPDAYTRHMTQFLRHFTSSKMKAKIIEVYNWESLQSDIDKNDISLPETSKNYITKTYESTKINSKGKGQKRLIKFTTNSLLNIDPRSKRVQNEKKLAEILKISASIDGAEILLHFASPSNNMGCSPQLKKKKSRRTDKLQRKYIFGSTQDRDEVLLDFFRIGFLAPSYKFPQEYSVIKVNKRGRHQDRILKLTCDSLLNLDGSTIKSEISLSGIYSVEEDESKPSVVWLQFKAEKKRRKIICSEYESLVCALKEVIERKQLEEEIE